jgi:hypothetical protein
MSDVEGNVVVSGQHEMGKVMVLEKNGGFGKGMVTFERKSWFLREKSR